MYADYIHASIAEQRAMYGTPPSESDRALVIWLPGKGQKRSFSSLQASAALPWVTWEVPEEAEAALSLTPPLRFIRVDGSACVEPAGLASACSTVHAMIAQAESRGYRSERIAIGGFGQGGALALAAGRAYSKPLAAIISFSGWVAGMCAASAANASTPIMLCHGTTDGTVSHHLLGESASFLRGQHGATIAEHSIRGLGHTDSADEAALLRDFLAATLPRGGASAAPHADAAAPPPASPAQSKSVLKMGGVVQLGGEEPPSASDAPRPPKPSAEGLPPGWVVSWSKGRQRWYYFDTRRNQSLWERPSGANDGGSADNPPCDVHSLTAGAAAMQLVDTEMEDVSDAVMDAAAPASFSAQATVEGARLSASAEELTVVVPLPGIESMASLDLDLSRSELTLAVHGVSAPMRIGFPTAGDGHCWDADTAKVRAAYRTVCERRVASMPHACCHRPLTCLWCARSLSLSRARTRAHRQSSRSGGMN